MERQFIVRLDEPRGLTSEEWRWIDKLLSVNIRDRDVLRQQLIRAKVVGYCNCGCKSITLKVPEGSPRYPHPVRVPVEMQIEDPPILFLLHVVDGFVDELEVLRGDSLPVTVPIPIHKASVTVNVGEQ